MPKPIGRSATSVGKFTMFEKERTPEQRLNSEWQKAIQQGIRDAVDNFELFGMVNVSPLSVSGGEDERTFLDLSEQEQDFIKSVLFKEIGLDPQSPENVASYITQAPERSEWQGEADVKVYKTTRSDEGMFLHEIHYSDNKVDYVVAPEDFQL